MRKRNYANKIEMKNLAVIFVLFQAVACGQVATISEVKRQPNTRLFNTKDSAIIYPVVVTNAKAIDDKMNFQIQETLLHPDSAIANNPVEEILDTAILYGLTFMSYEITFNRDHVLSFTVTAENCGANCSEWQSHFNFNTQTGDRITIDDILKSDLMQAFKDSVFRRKVNELVRYKSKLKDNLERKHVDHDSYAWAMEQVELYCINSISLEQFSLSGSGIEIFDNCEFPRLIRELQPGYHLNYSYSSINELLTPGWKKILMK